MRFGQYQKHLWTFRISRSLHFWCKCMFIIYIYRASTCIPLEYNLLVIFITLIIPVLYLEDLVMRYAVHLFILRNTRPVTFNYLHSDL